MKTQRATPLSGALSFLAVTLALGCASSHQNENFNSDQTKNVSRNVAQARVPCAHFAPGDTVRSPKNLYSEHGQLNVDLSYETNVNEEGHTEFCYLMEDGTRSPTLHLVPGDNLILTLTNKTSAPASATQMHMDMPVVMHAKSNSCGPGKTMDETSTNIHFHGTNVSPACHEDEAIYTMVNAGQSFVYNLHIPKDEPAGLYWYHPHVHGMSEDAVLGGASGAIVIEGIQHYQTAAAGLPERVLVIRDNVLPGPPAASDSVPSWDLSINFVPVPYPKYPPAIIPVKPKTRELWRVLNASADTILDLQLNYDGVNQKVELVGMDGVPINSQEEPHVSAPIFKDHVFLPPAARAEFIVTTPDSAVKAALLSTLAIDTGPAGDSDVARPIASLQFSAGELEKLPIISKRDFQLRAQRFEGVHSRKPVQERKLYFSEVVSNPADPASPTDFFITEDSSGVKPRKFALGNPPAITVHQGDVEDWTIENRSQENHEFHIHQIHFLLLERNGVAVLADDSQLIDMVDVPYWTGTGPYPSVKVRMDFRGEIAGDFVYHCHILEHEDNGMMAVIRVLPR